jgi:methyl-accepting chemotaxis protein
MNNAGGVRNRRRRRIIDPRFQWKYASLVALTVFVGSVLMSFTWFFILHQQARQRVINPQEALPRLTMVIVCFAVGWGAVMGAIVALGSFVFTHRISGPLYVLQGYFRELAAGRLPTVRALRTKDEFKDLMAGFAKAVESLKEGRQRTMALVDEALDVAKQPADQKGRDAITRLTSRVEEERRQQQQPVCSTGPAPSCG